MAIKPTKDSGKKNVGAISSRKGASGSVSSTRKNGASNLAGTGSAKVVPVNQVK